MAVRPPCVRTLVVRVLAFALALAVPLLLAAPLDRSGAVVLPASVRPAAAATPGWTASGLRYGWVWALAADPSTPTTLYAGVEPCCLDPYTARGVYKSTDAGATWRAVLTGVAGQIRALAIHPSSPQTVYVATEGAGILKSTNGGGTWTAVNTGLTNLEICALAIAPSNPAIVYAGCGSDVDRPDGMFKSTDAGASWQPVHGGPPVGTWVAGIVFDPQTPATLYAGAYTFYPGVYLGGVFKSTDGAATWKRVTPEGPPYHLISSLAMHPTTPTTLYAGVGYTATSPGGVIETTDGGATWTARSQGMETVYVRAFAFHPADPRIVYAGGDGTIAGSATGIVFQSNDGGGSWVPVVDGLNGAQVLSLLAVPGNPAVLYAGTNGGVFRREISTVPPPTVPTATSTATSTRTPTPTATPTVTPTPQADGANLIQNPSFELVDTKGLAASWFPRSTTIRDTTIRHSGAASLRLEGPASGQVGVYTFQSVALTAGRTYEISGWVKTQNLTGSGVRIRYAQLSPSSVTWDTPTTDGTVDWTQVRRTFTLPTTYQSGRLDVYWNMKPGDRAWVDDVTLTCRSCP